MTFHLAKRSLFFLFLLLSTLVFGKDIPKVSLPVTDQVGILTKQEVAALNQRIINFMDTTSNEIAVLITSDIGNYAIDQFTFEFGTKNGPGKKGIDNGIAIVIVPKTSRSNGQMFIATGYGLEGAIPDIIGKRIVENEFIPFFKKNDYYGGIVTGLDVIMKLAAGEISVKTYQKKKKNEKKSNWFVVLIIVGFALYSFFGKAKSARRYGATNNLPFWAAMAMMSNSSRKHSGHFNNFSSGSGPFGGGGGFGGFGGGGFGGGGAGGSW